MTSSRRHGWLPWIMLAGLLLLGGALVRQWSGAGAGGAGDSESDPPRATSRDAAGVGARPVDAPTVAAGWREPDVDPGTVARALERPASGQDVALLDLQANRDLGPWLAGLVEDDEFGHRIAACRARYERRQTRRCVWRQDVVLQRKSSGAARVVAVEPRLGPSDFDEINAGPPSPQCAAWARCVADAWRGRPALYPAGVDDLELRADDGSAMIALSSEVFHVEAYALDRDSYMDAVSRYHTTTQFDADRREAYYARAMEEESRSPAALESILYLLWLERAKARSEARFLEMLRSDALP